MTTRRDALVVLSAAALQSAAAEPKFLTADELALTAKLVDLIIPRTDTPSALDAQVHVLIDARAAANAEFGSRWREVLKKLGSGDTGAAVEREYQAKSSEFKLLKDTTIDLYYSTKEGLATELGWHGNTYLPEFKGCAE